MKKLVIASFIMAITSTFTHPLTVENREYRSPRWKQSSNDHGNKKMYGVLFAKGGVRPLDFEIVSTQNTVVTLEEDHEHAKFTAMILDCNKPASFQYIAIDTKKQKSAPGTITLKCGFIPEEVATAEGKNKVK